MPIKSVLINSTQRDNLIKHENGHYSDMTIALCEGSAQPSDFCYITDSGDYEIDESAYIWASERNFDWQLAKEEGYRK